MEKPPYTSGKDWYCVMVSTSAAAHSSVAVADTPAEQRGSFIISGAFFCFLSTKEVKVKVGDYLGCDLDNANVVDLNAPNSLPLYRVDGINYPQDGSNPILFISFTQPVHP